MRTLQVRLLGIMAISFCNVIALVLPTAADPGDKAGWSVHIDPRKRAFLIYVPVADGSRVLTIGCLRDVDNFTVISSGLRIGANNETKATLAVSNGTARYAVDGEVEPDQATGMQAFNTDIDADAKALRQISGALLPVLEGKEQGGHRSHGRIRRVHAADDRFDSTFVTFQGDMLWIPLKAA